MGRRYAAVARAAARLYRGGDHEQVGRRAETAGRLPSRADADGTRLSPRKPGIGRPVDAHRTRHSRARAIRSHAPQIVDHEPRPIRAADANSLETGRGYRQL